MPDSLGILEEAIEEAVGVSSKKWALVVVALVVGAVGALWLTSRTRRGDPAIPPSNGTVT